MNTEKPILVFVPGGFHSPEAYAPTTSLLQQTGYTVVGVPLPTIGTEFRGIPPQQNADEDIAAVRAVLLQHIEAGKDVVLITHSYSGTVGSDACQDLSKAHRSSQNLPGGIIKLVYIAALVLDVGSYCWELSNDKPYDEKTLIFDGDLNYANPEHVVDWFYNECSPEDQERLPKMLKSQAWKVFMSKMKYAAWRDIPGVYLMTERDHAIPVGLQEVMLDAAKGHRFEVVSCDGDHSPFVSRPEFTVNVIRRAAGAKV